VTTGWALALGVQTRMLGLALSVAPQAQEEGSGWRPPALAFLLSTTSRRARPGAPGRPPPSPLVTPPSSSPFLAGAATQGLDTRLH